MERLVGKGPTTLADLRRWHVSLNPAQGIAIDFKDAVQPEQFGKIIGGLRAKLAKVSSQVRSAALCSKVDTLKQQFDPVDPNAFYTIEELNEGKVPELFEERLGFLREKKMWEDHISEDMLGGHKARWVIETSKHPRAIEVLDELEGKLKQIPGVRALRIGRIISASIDTDSKRPGEKPLPRADVLAAGLFLDGLMNDIEESAAMTQHERAVLRA